MGIASLSSHGRVLTEIKDSFVTRVSTAASVTDVAVHLTDGLQAGQTRTLKMSSLEIGASSGMDIVLLDEKIADRHVQVTFSRSAFGMLALVESYNSGVEVNGEAVPAGSDPFEVTLPFNLKIGPSGMRFQRPGVAGVPGAASAALASIRQPEQPSHPREPENTEVVGRRKWQVDPMVMLGVSGLGLLLIGGLLWHLLTERQNFVVDINTPAFAAVETQKSDTEWLAEARDRVMALGLENSINISVLSSGILRSEGTIPETEVDAYREFRVWFEGQSAAPSMVWDIEQTARLARLPSIGMVRFSEPAAVVLTSGTVISLGEELTDGWSLDAVDNTTLTLKRGQEAQVVNYRAVSE